MPAERLLQRGMVGGEAALRLDKALARAEGKLQRVVGAVEGKLVAGGGIGCAVDGVFVVARLFGERMARKEFVGRRMDGGEVGGGARCAVPDGELQLDADAPRAPAAQRGEETRVERGGGCRFLLHVPHHCTMRQPPKDNRK